MLMGVFLGVCGGELTWSKGCPEKVATSSRKAVKSRNDARPALPIAYPFVVAFVVFPTASCGALQAFF